MANVGIYDGTGPDGGGWLTFDLAELLDALGPDALAAHWRVLPPLSYVADADVAAFEVAEPAPGPWLAGPAFRAAAGAIHQVIDGRFEAVHESGAGRGPWLTLRAVDSSWWEVYSDDPTVEAALRSAFHDVRPARYSAGAS
jgi:hypothetical protein